MQTSICIRLFENELSKCLSNLSDAEDPRSLCLHRFPAESNQHWWRLYELYEWNSEPAPTCVLHIVAHTAEPLIGRSRLSLVGSA